MGRKLEVEIYHDPDVEDPCDEAYTWRVYSFSRKHESFKDPGEFFEGSEPNEGLSEKLARGTAFILSYFEHGQCRWMLADTDKDATGMAGDWRWDGVDVAGVLVWEHSEAELGESHELKRQSAEIFLQVYTEWCNSETYGYNIADEHGNVIDSYGGFIGTEALINSVINSLDEGDEITDVPLNPPGLSVEDFADAREKAAQR